MTAEPTPAGSSPLGTPSREAFEIALWQLTEQQRSVENVDNKAAVVLTAALAFAGLFGAATTFAVDTDVMESAAAAVIASLIVLGSLSWSLVAVRRAIETSDWIQGPEGRSLAEVATAHPEDQVRLWLLERVIDSYLANDPLLDRKARWLSRALMALIVEGLATAIGLIVIATTAVLFRVSG